MERFEQYLQQTEEIGFIEEVSRGIVVVDGLPSVRPEEVVLFETGEFGVVWSLSHESATILLFTNVPLPVGTRVVRTGQQLTVPVGDFLCGSVVSSLGNPLFSSSKSRTHVSQMPVQVSPEGIAKRVTITKPLETGVTVVDMLVPLAKGQRELVIGDRKIGKTNFLLQTILTQAKQGMICIYAAIGKKRSDIKKLEEFFIQHKIMQQVCIVGASSQDPNASIYFAPFTAMTIAEYFKQQGKDTLVIFDDLSTHARFCREISLLAKDFPGRDSYPVDIFYTHARLLERAGNFHHEKGSVSITAFPVAETTGADLSGYIQTNLMSMTDGHIFFDSDLFARGHRPSVNPFLSVTRVGHQAQLPLLRHVSREVTTFLTLFEKIQRFVHFGAELSPTTQQTLLLGERINSFFTQGQHQTLPLVVQVVFFAKIWLHQFDQATPQAMHEAVSALFTQYTTDGAFRTKLDMAVATTETFNDFLHFVQSQEQKGADAARVL